MTEDEEIEPRAAEIGKRVKIFRDQAGLTVPQLAAKYGVQKDGINRIQSGKSNGQWVKLAELAGILKVTPNDLLGFNSISGKEILRGALEASYLALGLDEDQARALAEIILKVIDEPPVESVNMDRATLARVRSETEVRRLLRSKLAQ